MKKSRDQKAIEDGGNGSKVVAATLGAVTQGAAAEFGGLAMLPLLGAPRAAADYVMLAEALASGGVRVTEVSEGGSVPELAVVNDRERPVLLIDGEELVGAKQNRVLNLTVLVPGLSRVAIPVSCVEQGRWSWRTDAFSHAGRALFSKARAKKVARVTEHLLDHASRHADQEEIWEEVAHKLCELHASSPTGAMGAAFESRRVQLDGYRQALRPVEGQCGAVFSARGKVVGLDLFDRPGTWAVMHDSLVGSYAMDVGLEGDAGGGVGGEIGASLDGKGGGAAGTEDPAAFLREVAVAEERHFDAVGMGRDVRLAAPRLSGGGLALEGRIVHLCAFRVEEAGRGRGSDFASPSQRELWYRMR